MARDLATFALPPHLRAKLTRAGFRTVADIADIKAIDLAKGWISKRTRLL